MKNQILTANFLSTICWVDDTIVDWASSGTQYLLNGDVKQIGKDSYTFSFDSAISSENGQYVLLYQKLGTKGLLLKDGEILREINRSYYCANNYEFPAAFVTIETKTYLIHCPIAYSQLDFEDVETGELVTNIAGREPDDIFHSRLEISPNGIYFMSKGWVWHPLDQVIAFDIKECLANPKLLDNRQLHPDVGVEICTASFINDNEAVIGSSDEIIDDDKIELLSPKAICVWNLKTNQLSRPVLVKGDFGNLFAIDSNRAWDLFIYPKIIDINTGDIVEQNKEVNSGQQKSSIINSNDYFPSIIYNRQTKQIAINANEKIEVLTQNYINSVP